MGEVGLLCKSNPLGMMLTKWKRLLGMVQWICGHSLEVNGMDGVVVLEQICDHLGVVHVVIDFNVVIPLLIDC